MAKRRKSPRPFARAPRTDRIEVGPVTVDRAVLELGITAAMAAEMVESHRERLAYGLPARVIHGRELGPSGSPPPAVHPFRVARGEVLANRAALRDKHGFVRSFFAVALPDPPSPQPRRYQGVAVETDMRGPRTRVHLVTSITTETIDPDGFMQTTVLTPDEY